MPAEFPGVYRAELVNFMFHVSPDCQKVTKSILRAGFR